MVHGTPAVALPLKAVGTEVRVLKDVTTKGWELHSDVELSPEGLRRSREMLAAAVQGAGLDPAAARRVEVTSTIPLGHGLGSSASFSVALCGALARAAGDDLEAARLRRRAHQLEKLVHGTPSGIDDAVVTLERPVWFVRGQPLEPLEPAEMPRLILASSGAPGDTGRAVASVGQLAQADPDLFQDLCARALEAVEQGRAALMSSDWPRLGRSMDACHALLQHIGVSTIELDRLVDSARHAGALGAKLTGSGLGGFVMALVDPPREQAVAESLRHTGADLVFTDAISAG